MWQVCIFKLFFTFMSFFSSFPECVRSFQFCFCLKMFHFSFVFIRFDIRFNLIGIVWRAYVKRRDLVKSEQVLLFENSFLKAVDSQSRHPESTNTPVKASSAKL